MVRVLVHHWFYYIFQLRLSGTNRSERGCYNIIISQKHINSSVNRREKLKKLRNSVQLINPIPLTWDEMIMAFLDGLFERSRLIQVVLWLSRSVRGTLHGNVPFGRSAGTPRTPLAQSFWQVVGPVCCWFWLRDSLTDGEYCLASAANNILDKLQTTEMPKESEWTL